MQDLSVKPRSQRLAAWANCVAPGLGFYYLGLPHRAWIFLLLAAIPWFILLLLPWHQYPWLPVLALLLSLLVLMVAMRQARSLAGERSPMILQSGQRWLSYLFFTLVSLSLIVVWLCLLSVKSGLIPYQVSVNSMVGTVNKYDWLLITRKPPELDRLRRGEIVLFVHPELGRTDIQRVVGLPGERIAVHAGGLFVDGDWHSEPYLDEMKNQQKLPEGVVETRVPDGAVFVLADNRDASRDSRYWGALPADAIESKLAYRLNRGPDDWMELLRAYLSHSFTQ